jgi:hypothetical protein
MNSIHIKLTQWKRTLLEEITATDCAIPDPETSSEVVGQAQQHPAESQDKAWDHIDQALARSAS